MNMLKSLGLLMMGMSLNIAAEDKAPNMTVYRSPTCGCCGKWLNHAEKSSFKINDVISDDMQAIKARYGVPDKLASCHTVLIDGYIIEGHVPAEDIQKLLQTKPNIVGLAAPGMPMGSPGMEMGDNKDVYQVMSFDKEGRYQVFATHGNE